MPSNHLRLSPASRAVDKRAVDFDAAFVHTSLSAHGCNPAAPLVCWTRPKQSSPLDGRAAALGPRETASWCAPTAPRHAAFPAKTGVHTRTPLIASQSRKAKPSYKRIACHEAPRREIQTQHSSRISRRGLLEPVIRSWLLNSTATRSTLATLLHCHLFDSGPHDLIPHKLGPRCICAGDTKYLFEFLPVLVRQRTDAF